MMSMLFNFLLFASITYSLPEWNAGISCPSPSDEDPKQLLKSLNEFYSSHDYICHELSYILYPDHQSTIPVSVDKGIFMKQGNTQYAQLSSVESLTTADYTIGIDNEEKTIMIANHLYLPPTGPMGNLAEWMNTNSAVKVTPVSDRSSAISFTLDYGELENATIQFDKITYQPEKLVLIYRRSIQLTSEEESTPVKPRLEIVYTKTLFDGQGKDQLNMRNYVFQKDNQWMLTPKYKEYELINNINELAVHK